MKSLEIEQCVESIGLIISYFSLILLTSNLIKHSLEHMQLEVRCNKPIFNSSYSKLSFLAIDCWLKAV